VKERPGEAYQLLSELAEAGVNLLAFSAIPIGPGHTRLVLFPNKMERLVQVAEQLGLVLTGPQRAFLVQGDDRLGTIAEILSYSRSRGAFAGVSLEGATLQPDDDDNKKIYGKKVVPKEILSGAIAAPANTAALGKALTRYGPRN
jgi:hypothetical protein